MANTRKAQKNEGDQGARGVPVGDEIRRAAARAGIGAHALRIEPGALDSRIKGTVAELIASAELGEAVEQFAEVAHGVETGADAQRLRQAAAGIRAAAMQALLTSAATFTLSERLATIGFVRENEVTGQYTREV